MLRNVPDRRGIAAGLASSLCLCAASFAVDLGGETAYQSILTGPEQPLTDVLPESVLESIEAPSKPLRVAQRPQLDWRPGAARSADAAPAAKPQPTLRIKGAPTALRPVETAPRLEPPRRTATALPRSEEPDAGELLSRPPRRQRQVVIAPEPDPQVLPLQAPRLSGPTLPSAEPQEEPIADATPAAKKATPERTEPKLAALPKATKPRSSTSQPKAPASTEREQVEKPSPKTAKTTPAAPKDPPPPLTRSMKSLRSRMRSVLSFYYRLPLNTVEHDPWEVMHAMLAYELHSRVRDGGPRGDFMTAVGHLCFNRPSEGKRMMTLNRDGELDVQVGVSLQGHRGQLLAMLAQCNVSPDYPIRVDGEEFTIHDLIEAEQRTCYSKTELTFKLIGLGHYLDSDARWLNDQGEQWDIPRLIAEERAQPIRGAACGGTHRLAGLSLAFRRREARNEPVDGEYAEAARFVSQYQAYAFRLQNDDGSLSTEWFRGPGDEEDIDRRLRTTGHTLEWLVYSLPDDQLRSHRTVRAANYLTNLLAGHADHEWHLGSIAHALHALVLYDKRVFRPHDEQADGQLAATVDPTGRLFRDYPIYRGVMRNSPPKPGGFLGGLFGGQRTGSSANRRSR